MAHTLKTLQSARFELRAHTDDQGASDNNLALSQRRANTVKHYLQLRGVRANQVDAKGYGEAKPVSDNTTAEGRRRNRRVELAAIP